MYAVLALFHQSECVGRNLSPPQKSVYLETGEMLVRFTNDTSFSFISGENYCRILNIRFTL